MTPLPRPRRGLLNEDDRREERRIWAMVLAYYLVALVVIGVLVWAAIRFTLAYT